MKPASRNLLAVVLLTAFLLRLGAAAYWQLEADSEGRLFRLGDSHSYWTLAGKIAKGLPFEYGSAESKIFRAPLYPIVISPMTTLGVDSEGESAFGVWSARMLGCLLGTLAVGFVYLLGRRLHSHHAGLAAGWLAAFYPSAIGMSVIVLSEALFLPLMVATLLCWLAAWQSASWWRVLGLAILSGGVTGAAVLTRPSWLLFVPFLFALGLLFGPERKRHGVIFFASLLGLGVVMAPWWVRNASITGRFVPTTLQVGPSLYDGLHAGASGASDEGMEFMQAIIAEQMLADQQATQPLVSTLEYRINARAQAKALSWAASNPAEVVRLAGVKFLRIWTLWPDGGDVGSAPVRLGVSISCFAVLLLALGTSWSVRGQFDWSYRICWLPCLYFTSLHMVFVGSIRYREPAMFVLIALAGCAIAKLLGYKNIRSELGEQVAREDLIATATHT